MAHGIVSVGVLPNSTWLSAEEAKKLCYTTTSSSDFRHPKPAPGSAAESFKHLHWIGHRSGKYMQYPQKRAPYFQRTSCHYTMEFGPKPMSDLIGDREIMALNKQSHMDGPKALMGAKMDGTSKYSTDFRPFTAEEVRKARPGSAKPAQGKWKSSGKLYETKSMAHEHFGDITVSFNSGQVLKPESTLGKIKPGWAMSPMLPTTHYTEEFSSKNTVAGKQKMRCQSAPAGGRRRHHAEQEVVTKTSPAGFAEEDQRRKRRPTSAAAIASKIGARHEEVALDKLSAVPAARPGTAPPGQRRQRPQSAAGDAAKQRR
mmetsp:Transcript_58833/g.140291  ORF Transcript_58833/g.140291 Transcript_58833/m.140291 type:complete len:315 (-) Transcript_58833:16-960(-)